MALEDDVAYILMESSHRWYFNTRGGKYISTRNDFIEVGRSWFRRGAMLALALLHLRMDG